MDGKMTPLPVLSGTLSPEGTISGSLSETKHLSGSLDINIKSPYFETSNEYGTTISIG